MISYAKLVHRHEPGMDEIAESRSVAVRFLVEAARATAMQPVIALAGRAARTTVSVLITGESGTGKRALAHWIHASSERSGGPLVRTGGAAIAAALRSAVLRDRTPDGVFAGAVGGTLVIDELCDLPLDAQAALVQLLDTPVRGAGAIAPRMIATSQYAAERAVGAGKLRADLYYALGVIAITVPPLRQRAGDIPALVAAFLARSARGPVVISDAALAWLAAADWPGNVRELESAIERAVALSDGGVIEIEDFTALGLAPRSASRPAGAELTPDHHRRRWSGR